MPIDLRSLSFAETEQLVLSLKAEKYRAKQVYEWVHRKFADSIDEMTNLPKDFRGRLSAAAGISTARVVKKLQSQTDGTVKYLFGIHSPNSETEILIESVLMRYEYGVSVCLSTQAGCRMGCAFCASTIGGLERNLSAGEMLAQLYTMQKDTDDRISGIVLMGSGEPFDNFENGIKFLELTTSEKGINIGQRHITVSTCGLVPEIYEFAKLGLQVNLAVSLHAPNDEIRRELMPIARKYAMDEVLEACRFYAEHTKRRITFEYALVSGVNDSIACAAELGGKLKGTLSHVNLIPVNEVAERGYQKSGKATINAFAEKLKSFGVETTVRRKLGSDINASCGQLRGNFLSDATNQKG